MKVINLNRIVMLSTGLSMHSSVKLLERMFRVLLRGIDRKLQTGLWSRASTSEIALRQVVNAKKLKIARTTFPDERGDFNETFLNIRFGLDEFYRERNPIFHSPSMPEADPVGKFPKTTFKRPVLEIYHKEDKPISRSTDISPLWIAKTTLPAERRDFNETFLHIRTEIDRLYKEQNPAFDNAISSDILRDQKTQNGGQEYIYTKIRQIEQDILRSTKESTVKLSEAVAFDSSESGNTVSGMDVAMEAAIQDYLTCAETQESNQVQQLVNENVNKEESSFSEVSAADQEGVTDRLRRTTRIPELVGETLADGFNSGKNNTTHLKQDKKRRKRHHPLRIAWHFKDRKDGLREPILNIINSRNKSRAHPGRTLSPSLSRVS